MDVFWDNGLPLASNRTENQLAKNYRVEVAINGDQGQMPPPPGKTRNSGFCKNHHRRLENTLQVHVFLNHVF